MFTDTVRFGTRPRLALAAIGLLAVGGGVGAVVTHATQPIEAMAPAAPVRIAALATASRPVWGDPIVTVRGRIVEVYGGRFVLTDGSGTALVDTGPRGDSGALYALGQTVTVQGHFRDGTIRAAYLVTADGQVAALEPHGGPHGGPDGGPRGPHGDGPGHGPRDDGDRADDRGGPDAGPDRGPPPPPATAPSAAAPNGAVPAPTAANR